MLLEEGLRLQAVLPAHRGPQASSRPMQSFHPSLQLPCILTIELPPERRMYCMSLLSMYLWSFHIAQPQRSHPRERAW